MFVWGAPWWVTWLTGIGMALLGFVVVIVIDYIVDKHKKKKALRLLAQHKRAQCKLHHPHYTTGGGGK